MKDTELTGKRNRLASAILVGLLVASSAILALAPPVIAQSMGTLEQPYTDYGSDTDAPPDGLYNNLIVEVYVNVTQEGTFYLDGWLWDGMVTTMIDVSSETFLLVEANHSVPISFDGLAIRLSGIDGPYYVEIFLYNDEWTMVDSDTYTTGPYLASEFQGIPSDFWPPHSDYGLDINGNMLFDYLVVDVAINVGMEDTYYLWASLYDSTGMIFIDGVFEGAYLGVGLQTMELRFRGYNIFLSGFDGPYTVELTLYDSDWNTLDTDTHWTQAYLAVDFEQAPAAVFMPPHSDFGLDTDGDTYLNYLVAEAVVNASTAGYYNTVGTMWDGTGMVWIANADNYTYLSVGPQTVELRFLGYQIFMSGFDGPYQVDLGLYDEAWNFLNSSMHMTNFYLNGDFETLPAGFEPPHNDYGLDTDGDMLSNYLVLEVIVNVTDSGYYEVGADLYDNTGMNFIDSQSNYTYLDPGLQTMEIRYRGYDIYLSGFDGPYTVYLNLFDDWWNLLDTDVHVTQPYLFTDFEQNTAGWFVPSHSDYGLDTDGDSLYNYLVVEAVVDIDSPGFYRVTGGLYDRIGMFPISYDSNYTYLASGLHTVELRYLGLEIYDHGIDGPYTVLLNLADQDGNDLDTDLFWTNAYSYTDFDPPPGVFSPPHSDYGLDTDLPPDGFFNFLVVNLSVDINDPGMFMVQGILYDSSMTLFLVDTNYTYLDVGLQTVQLSYSGAALYLSGIDGPYYMFLILSAFIGDDMVDVDGDTYVTNSYSYTDFQAVNPAMIWGYVYDAGTGSPIPFASVDAINYTHRYINGTTANATGYYEMNVLEGDFHVLFDDDGYQSDLITAFVVGSMEVTNSLVEPLPSTMTSDVTFQDWDTFSMGMTGTLEEDNQTIRLMIDYMIGNMDGYVNQSELDAFIAFMGGSAFTMNDTIDQFYVDGIHYNVIPGTFQSGFGGAGPVTLKSPLLINVGANFTSDSPIPVSQSHLLELNMTYDTDTEETITYASITPAYVLDSFDPAANVTILGLGSSFITIDPHGDPNLSDGIDYVWINMTVITTADIYPPEISNVLIDGNPVTTYFLSALPPTFSLTATIDDSATGNSLAFGANYTTPTATSWPGVPMDAMDGTFDEAIEDVDVTISTPTQAGTYDYFVYAWDNESNYNNSAPFATLIIVDDAPPGISNVAIDGQAVVTYYLSALPATAVLTAVVNDTNWGGANIGGANYTTPTSTSWPGTPMDATDGAFDEPDEDVNITISVPAVVGTYDYHIYAWDDVPNYNNAAPSATLIIADDLPPEISNVAIDGQPSVTYFLSTLPATVTLTAMLNDTNSGGSNIGGANYTTPTATSWPGTAMQAEDGAFDSPTENVTVQIAIPIMAGTYDYYIYAWDADAGINSTAPFVTLIIEDDLPPEISNVLVDGRTSIVVTEGTDVELTATVDDTSTGTSNISGANYTIGLVNWPGTLMDASDGVFNSAQEDVEVIIDTNGWSEGTHEICVYAWDEGPAYNTTSTACLDVVIDDTSPAIDNITVDPDPQDTGEDVLISATVTDDNNIDEVRIEITDPDGTVLGDFLMTYSSVSGKYEYTNAYDATGTYTFTISATDDAGNSATESGDFTIKEAAGPGFFDEYWWLIVVIVIIIVAIVVVLLAMRRKPRAEEYMPPPPQEVAPPPPPEPMAEAPPEPPAEAPAEPPTEGPESASE